MSYSAIRTVHLLLGLCFMLFLLMYGVSAVQMAYPDRFDSPQRVTEASFGVDPAAAADPAALAGLLRQERDVRGELRNLELRADGYAFQVVRPGTVHDVSFSRDSGRVRLRTSVAGVLMMLNRIHHVGGVQNEYGLLNVWGTFVGLTSVGLILSGLTGVYMWFRSHRGRRTPGAIFLGFSLTVSLLLIVLIRMA